MPILFVVPLYQGCLAGLIYAHSSPLPKLLVVPLFAVLIVSYSSPWSKLFASVSPNYSCLAGLIYAHYSPLPKLFVVPLY
jgi:hypothetical protein